jgi:hypothetical protein
MEMGQRWRDAGVAVLTQGDPPSLKFPPLQLGLWEYDARADRCTWEPSTYMLHGIELGQPVNFDIWAASIRQEERDRAIRACRKSLDRDAIMDFTYRTEHGRQIILRGRVLRDREGRPVSASGVTIDVAGIQTALSQAYAAAVEVGEMLGADDADPDGSQILIRQIRDMLGSLAV